VRLLPLRLAKEAEESAQAAIKAAQNPAPKIRSKRATRARLPLLCSLAANLPDVQGA
jgi:hypothetical protein